MKRVPNPETGKEVTYERDSRTYFTSANGERPAFTRFVDEPSYTEALSGVVIKCVDVVVFDPATLKILIAQRAKHPHPGVWLPGGRKRAGETDTETAVANLKREFGVDVPEEEILPVGTQYELIWDAREQPPTVNENDEPVTGCHMSSTLMMLPANEASLKIAPNEEYSESSWVDFDEIMEAQEDRYHPALVQMTADAMERYTQPDYAGIIQSQGLSQASGAVALRA